METNRLSGAGKSIPMFRSVVNGVHVESVPLSVIMSRFAGELKGPF